MQRLKTYGWIGLALLGLGLPTALAAKGDGPKARFFAKYDVNKNGVIDGAEKDAVRKDYAANKEGDLKRFDTDKDGRLSDEELAAIKPPAGKKKSDASAKSSDTAGQSAGKSDGEKSGSQPKPAAEKPGESTATPPAKTP